MRWFTVVLPIVNGASSTNVNPLRRYHSRAGVFWTITPSQISRMPASVAFCSAARMSAPPIPIPW